MKRGLLRFDGEIRFGICGKWSALLTLDLVNQKELQLIEIISCMEVVYRSRRRQRTKFQAIVIFYILIPMSSKQRNDVGVPKSDPKLYYLRFDIQRWK